MNTQQIISWMENPGMLGNEASAELDDLTQRFPFFQSAQLLYIKSLHNENNFLYNNQLKVAAAYAVNRKVLYDLITTKPSSKGLSQQSAVSGRQSAVGSLQSEVSSKQSAVGSLQSEETVQTNVEIKELTTDNKQPTTAPVFPKKKLTNDPDEWETGMMRQLQMLHHWQTSPEEILRQRLKEIEEEKRSKEEGTTKKEESTASKEEGTTSKEIDTTEKPTATDEINTLLYVLVEPNSEDVSNPIEETLVETTDDSNWEVKEIDPENSIEPIDVPEDNVEQEIIREAITSSIELEVDDSLPTLEELTGIPKEKKELKIELPKFEEKKAAPRIEKEPAEEEETVNSSEEPSFAQWVKALKKTEPEIESPKIANEENKLIEKFITDAPRIQPSKTAFYNPVNMARKSVQDSDEFITETLARIYAKQGNIPKAIRAYQKLSLKFPEKTAYFAALIEELKRTPTK